MAIAELKARATMDKSQFDSALGSMKSGIGGIASPLKALGGMVGAAFSVGAVVAFGKALAAEASQTKRMSDGIGVSVGMLDELGDMAERAGASGEGFQQKIARLVDTQEEAAKGNKEAAESFARLGISVGDLTKLSPEQLLERVAIGAQNDATAISDLNNVMGKGAGTEFYSTLKKIAQDGLPAVDASVEESIKRFAELESKYQSIKDTIGEVFMKSVVGTVQFFGGMKDSPSGDSDIEQRNKEIMRRRGLEEARNQQRQEALNKINLDKAKKEQALADKRGNSLDKITVGGPKTSDSLARIGGMVGLGVDNSARAIAERQLKEAEIMADYMRDMAKVQEETKTAIQKLGEE